MSDGDMLVAGKITGSYGIKGWVRVHSYTDPQENFLALGQWHVQRRGEPQPLAIDDGKAHGKGLVVHVEGVDDRTAAESLRGLQVLVPRDVLPPLDDGDYYWRDLEGLSVWCRDSDGQSDGDRVLLGEVDYLIETGANDVLVVRACQGSIDTRERLIPYLPGQVVTRVDLAQRRIEVDWFIDDE